MDFSKYINIPYKHLGRNTEGVDCYGLVRLVYETEKGIILPEFQYEFDWVSEGCNHVVDGMNSPEIISNWAKVNKPYKPLDIIIFYLSNKKVVANHIGIIINDDKFLHVRIRYPSCVDRLSGFWESRIYAALRYVGDKV